MNAEIPIWVDGAVQWLSGVDRRTTCRDVLELFVEGSGGGDVCNFELIERWRQVERPLDLDSRLLKIWSHWGDEQKEVRLCLRRVDNEADSGRGSPVGTTPSLKRRRHRKGGSKQAWSHHEDLHPRRLAELGGFDKDEFQEFQLRRLEAEDSGTYAYGEKTYATTHEAGHIRRKNGHRMCSGTGTLHSTAIEGKSKKCCSKRSNRPKVRNSENIEKLMKLILAQGATIQSQLNKLKEREQQIENIEVERHIERSEKNGRNYLLETYLKSLKEAEVPVTDEEKGNDSGVHTENGSEQTTSGEREITNKEPLPYQLKRSGSETITRRSRSKQVDKTDGERQPRSKSESRTEIPSNPQSLVRTLSDHLVKDSCEVQDIFTDAKDEEGAEEDIVELTRVQSQVEMWEKVLKINKKLEKEEENLVKLHIQIRRIQSENIKFARDQNPADPVSKSLQKQLEVLRSDLDQNSKEIYSNFTQLIQEDEQVVKKQNYLSELINDLGRTDEEHVMLSEMVTAMSSTHIPVSSDLSHEPIGISLQVKGQEKIPQPDLIQVQPRLPVTQEEEVTLPPPELDQSELIHKPKILKISFDENIIESNPNIAAEKSNDPSPVPTRNIKGILKNRKREETFYLGDLEKSSINYGSNLSSTDNDSKIGKTLSLEEAPSTIQSRSVCHNPIYSHPVPSTSFAAAMENPYEHLFPNIDNRREAIYHPATPQKVTSIDGHTRKSDCDALYARPVQTTVPVFGVTAKTVVPNDTDSSGSSDTSGLSSMYSASPTVEEPTYVLNTLV